jgi:hypothetical protein
MNYRLLFAMATAFLFPETVDSQSSTVGDGQPNIFQESSTIALGSPRGKDLLFEARPALHLYALNQFGDKVWQKTGKRDAHSWLPLRPAMATSISFLPEIRMSTDRSSPVRTPSYRIRVTHQLLWMERGKAEELMKYRVQGLKLTAFGHYSNGQSGCRLRGFTITPTSSGDSTCTPSDAVLAAKRIVNVDNGDFSTSYFALAFDRRTGRIRDATGPMVESQEWGVEYQNHPLGLQPGGTDRDQATAYGTHEVSGRYGKERRFGTESRATGVLRVSVLGVARFGRASKPLQRLESEASYIFDGLGAFGIFVRHHAGYDHYNINYFDKRPFFAFGFKFDPGRLDLVATDAR